MHWTELTACGLAGICTLWVLDVVVYTFKSAPKSALYSSIEWRLGAFFLGVFWAWMIFGYSH